MTWQALVPLKAVGRRKTRLAAALTIAERDRLTEDMRAHVIGVLGECPAIAATTIVADDGTGLNPQLRLASGRLGPAPLLVLFADLPLLAADDVGALLAAASTAGVALAPDRAGTGTNAVAVADGRAFGFSFGPDSLAQHRAVAPDAAIVRRPGLAFDIDKPADLDEWRALGTTPHPAPRPRMR